MAAILTLTQQQLIKKVDNAWANNKNFSDAVTNYYELEQLVEETDLAKMLGYALLQDLQENPILAHNVTLLNGGSFTDCRENTIKFKGVRYILAFLIHSRYVDLSAVQDSATGLVQKKREHSESASKGSKQEVKNFSEEIYTIEYNKLKKFLDENSETYPLWVREISKKPLRSTKLRTIRNRR